jgi:hypothetical protein
LSGFGVSWFFASLWGNQRTVRLGPPSSVARRLKLSIRSPGCAVSQVSSFWRSLLSSVPSAPSDPGCATIRNWSSPTFSMRFWRSSVESSSAEDPAA